jgi:hypothetical protein
VELPQTLHAQLYLLTYDQRRHRFDVYYPQLFGFALRAAMLTDLYLTGHLEDKEGKAYAGRVAQHDDAVLHEALKDVTGRDWAQFIAHGEHHARQVVRDQLEATGWLRVRQGRMLGIIPTRIVGLYDEDMVSGLADRVTDALRNAIDDRPADPRPLAVGLLAVLAQMPVVSSFMENARHREELREMTFAAIEPILGLHQAIQNHHTDMRSRIGHGL